MMMGHSFNPETMGHSMGPMGTPQLTHPRAVDSRGLQDIRVSEGRGKTRNEEVADTHPD